MRRAGSVGKVGIQSKGSAKQGTLKKAKNKDFVEKTYQFLNNSVSSGFPDNTSATINPPNSNLGDYIFSLETSLGGFINFQDYATSPKSKIHVTNISDLNNIVSFAWTPPDSVDDDFYNANEALIWGNDIYVVYKWAGGMNASRFTGIFEHERRNVDFPGYENMDIDDDGEFDLVYTDTFRTGFNKVLKLVNCSIDESAEEILYDSYEVEVLDFVMSAHGNTVNDDYWILEERSTTSGAPASTALIPLSGSISNWKYLQPDPYMYKPSPFSSKVSVSNPAGAVTTTLKDKYKIEKEGTPYVEPGDQITCSDKFVYTSGRVYFGDDSIYAPSFYSERQKFPFATNPGQPGNEEPYLRSLNKFRIDGEEYHVVHPFLCHDAITAGRYHNPTIYGDYIITIYSNDFHIIIYKYNRVNPSLEIKVFVSIESGVFFDSTYYTEAIDQIDFFENLDVGDASISAENIYSDLVSAGCTIATSTDLQTEEYPNGNYVNVGSSHFVHTDGTYIWVGTNSVSRFYRFSFDTLELQETSIPSDRANDDICIVGNNVFASTDGSSPLLQYIQKDDFSSGWTTISEASFTLASHGTFYQGFKT
jgi:hypothetical protein